MDDDYYDFYSDQGWGDTKLEDKLDFIKSGEARIITPGVVRNYQNESKPEH